MIYSSTIKHAGWHFIDWENRFPWKQIISWSSWCVLFNHKGLYNWRSTPYFLQKLSICSTCPPNPAVLCIVSKAEPGHSKYSYLSLQLTYPSYSTDGTFLDQPVLFFMQNAACHGYFGAFSCSVMHTNSDLKVFSAEDWNVLLASLISVIR